MTWQETALKTAFVHPEVHLAVSYCFSNAGLVQLTSVGITYPQGFAKIITIFGLSKAPSIDNHFLIMYLMHYGVEDLNRKDVELMDFEDM